MIEFRPATQKDVEAFYNGKPMFSMTGIIALEDGKPIGICGVYHCEGMRIVFSEMKQEARKYRKLILKIAKLLMHGIQGKVYANANPDEQTAHRFLTHLGFRQINHNLYERD